MRESEGHVSFGDGDMLEEQQRKVIREIAGALRPEWSVLFVTGAGMSADSGLPTYRGIGGLYDDADTEEGMPIEVALSGPMLATRPEVTWRHILQIEEACRGAKPNAGHTAIAELQSRFANAMVLTQNVDGLHQAAGTRDVIDIHGDVHELYCTSEPCDWSERVVDYQALSGPVPRCPRCGAVVRPDVVLFGEMLSADKIERLLAAQRRGFDAVFSVGTTSVFPYIAGPVVMTARAGRMTVEINPGTSEVSHLVQHRIQAGAAECLVELSRAMDDA